ncbi:MAG TPA: hypothetical protein VMJ10_22340 [Kofleriaceae bacterium]|nr:hypothetical protein [Kofleriaceae bacterium]
MIDSLPGGDQQPLSQVIGTQPGFVTDTFGFGLHARAADGGLQYEIDGIPLLAPPLTQWASTESFIPTKIVDTLHIITGGFPAEYGDGLGGVIDITTRRPTGGPSSDAQIAYGSYNTTRASLDYAQGIGKLGVFVAGNFERTDRGLDPPAPGEILHDRLLGGGGIALVTYDATPRDRVELIAFGNDSAYQIPIDPQIPPLSALPPGTMRSPDSYGNPPPPFVPYDANPTDTELNVFAALSYRHVFGDATLQIAPFIRDSYGDLLCDPVRSLGATADPGSTCSDVRRSVFHEGLVAHYSWAVARHHVVKMGATADNANSWVDYAAYTRDDASPHGGPDPAATLSGADRTDVLLAGAYIQDTISYGKWSVLPGARIDIQSVDFLGSDEPSLLLVGPSARLGASYAATRDIALHAFVGSLWQPPNTVDAAVAARVLVPALAGQPLPVDLKAEKDWAADAGISDRVARWLIVQLDAWGRLATDQLDRQLVGNTNLMASYNFARGRAAGVELSGSTRVGTYVDAFANAGWQLGQGQGVASERYLFTPDELADQSWQILDHVQSWTANVGFDLHEGMRAATHLSGLFSFGSGLRTGATNEYTLPPHATFDLTLRHRFDLACYHPELAIDIYNLFDDVYAYRLATGNDGSAWALPRTVFVRLALPLAP